MSVDVLGYLSSKGLLLKRAGGNEIHTHCPLCGEAPDKRGRLYVNVDPEASIPGLFFCHRCGEKGSLTTLKRHYGDPVNEKDEKSERGMEILQIAADFYHERLGDYEDVFRYLRGPKRGLTTTTIIKNKVGYAPQVMEWDVQKKAMTATKSRELYSHLRSAGYDVKEILATGLCRESGKSIVDSLSGMITIPYMTAGNVSMIRGRSWPYAEEDWEEWTQERYAPPPMKYKTSAGVNTRLFNSDVVWNAEEVLVTEGEFDCMVLEQEGYTVVGVSGANAWQDAWDGYMTNMKRIFLVFDRDKAGEDGSKKLVERFGSKVRRVHLSEEGQKCDPTMFFHEQQHTKQEFETLLQDARKGGLLITVHDAIHEFENRQALPGLKFNHELLDLMLEPGIHPAQLVILLAKTGTGKTITLLNWMHRMRMYPGQEDKKFLFISLEQTRGEWWDRARRIYRFYNPHLRDDREAMEWWHDNILIVDKNRLSMQDYRQIIDDFIYRMGQLPDAVFLDYLGYFARGFRGEAYERTSNAVMELKGWGKEVECPMFVPHQVSRVGKDGEEMGADAARDSGVIEETADFLFTLWTPDNSLARNEEEKTGKLHERIAKSRHGGKGQLLDLQFAPLSLAMVPTMEPEAHRARQEFNWRREYRDNWERAAYRHRTGMTAGVLADVPAEEFEQRKIL